MKDFTVELGESISTTLEDIPEYPQKLHLTYHGAFWSIYKIYDRITIERVVLEDHRKPDQPRKKRKSG